MNSDNLDPVEMKNRWYPSEDPQERFTRRDLEAEAVRWELEWEEVFWETAPAEPPVPPRDKELRKRARLSEEQLDYIRVKYGFLFRNYQLYKHGGEIGYRWPLPYILEKMKGNLLKDFKSSAEWKAEKAKAKAERARIASEKYALKPSPYAGMSPEEKAAAVKAKMSAGIKAAWARRKAQKGNQ